MPAVAGVGFTDVGQGVPGKFGPPASCMRCMLLHVLRRMQPWGCRVPGRTDWPLYTIFYCCAGTHQAKFTSEAMQAWAPNFYAIMRRHLQRACAHVGSVLRQAAPEVPACISSWGTSLCTSAARQPLWRNAHAAAQGTRWAAAAGVAAAAAGLPASWPSRARRSTWRS